MKALDKEILRLALPSILANITVPVVGMVDIAVAGHLNAATAACIGGISIGSMLFDLLYWNFGFLRAGTGGLTAQAFGRGDMHECARTFFRGILFAAFFAVLILAVRVPFTKLALLVTDCSEEVRDLALQYFFIRVWAAPATLSLMTFRGWFIGMQDSVSSMWTDLIINGVNIAASIILTLGAGSWEGLGFRGVAYGTLLAQYSGLVFATLTVVFKYRRKVFAAESLRTLKDSLRGSDMKAFFSLNTDLFIRSLCFIIIYIGFTMLSARFGDLMLASSSIMMKLLMIFSYFTDGFAYAGQALTGRFIGAGDNTDMRKCIKAVFLWSMCVAAGFMMIYKVLGVAMLRIMTSDGSVVDACRQFLPWLVLMPPLGCAAFTWDGIYEGATASRPVRNAMLCAAVVFFLCWAGGKIILESEGILNGENAIHLLLGAYFAHLAARTAWLSASYRKHIRNRV